MPSPFPGMNPYLEQDDVWEDFHHSFIVRAAEALSGLLGTNYFARIRVRPYHHWLLPEERWTASIFGLPAVDIERHSWLEIVALPQQRRVTVVELLSPTIKALGTDRQSYLTSRAQVLAGPAHLVEIDLRRGGIRPSPPELPPCDYYALVSPSKGRPRACVWTIGLRDRLPIIPIPRAATDPEVPLDLQEVLHGTYDAADYGKYIYGETPLPPDDAAWARQFVPQAPTN